MMVALFSEDFNTGTWMDDELKTANISGVPILTFRLSNEPFSETKAVFLKNTACVEANEDAEDKFPMLYEEVCNMLGLPIEQALPVEEVLIEKQPEKVAVVSQEKENIDEKQNTDLEKEIIVSKKTSHSLLPAIIIGVVLLLVVKLFLEWILN